MRFPLCCSGCALAGVLAAVLCVHVCGVHSGVSSVLLLVVFIFFLVWPYVHTGLRQRVTMATTPASVFATINLVRVQGDTLSYTGSGRAPVGGALASRPFSRRYPYFEITIVSLGEKGSIGVGASAADYSLGQMPGEWRGVPVQCSLCFACCSWTPLPSVRP